MHSVKYPDLSHLEGQLNTVEFKDKIKLDIERGNTLVNKALLQHNFLQRENVAHSKLWKRYRRLCNTATSIEVLLTSVEVAMSGMAVLATPIAPIFGVFALGAVSTKILESWLQKKLIKHKEYALLSDSKVKSLEEHFIKSMEDNSLSEDEYKIIKKEVELYLKHKNKIKESNQSGSTGIPTPEEQELLEHVRRLKNTSFKVSNNHRFGLNNLPSAPPVTNDISNEI